MIYIGDYVYHVDGTKVEKLYVWGICSEEWVWVQHEDGDGGSDKWLMKKSQLFQSEAEALDAAIVEAEDLITSTLEKIRTLREQRRKLYVGGYDV